jgi:hypothetical protein
VIERIVLLKVRDDLANAASRQEMAVYSGKVLRSIPGVVDAKVGVPADEAAEGSWDLRLAIYFDSYSDVEPYRVHPIHVDYVENFLKPRVTFRKAWNFEIAG